MTSIVADATSPFSSLYRRQTVLCLYGTLMPVEDKIEEDAFKDV
jgi:hypothetical protein